jgi:hypothetical protein
MKHFSPDQVINLIQSTGKIGGAALGTYGVQAQNTWASFVGFAVAAVSLWFSHHSAATPAPVASLAPAAADTTSKLPPVILCVLLAIGAVSMTACSTSSVATAYKVETATDITVITAWNLWQNYLAANPTISTNTQAQVSAAFTKVKDAEQVAIAATALAASSGTNGVSATAVLADSQATAAVLQALLSLLGTFNIKL